MRKAAKTRRQRGERGERVTRLVIALGTAYGAFAAGARAMMQLLHVIVVMHDNVSPVRDKMTLVRM